jgi:hypothetical protein
MESPCDVSDRVVMTGYTMDRVLMTGYTMEWEMVWIMDNDSHVT